MKFVGQRESHIDVLINNSGTNFSAPFEEYPKRMFEKVMDVSTPFFF